MKFTKQQKKTGVKHPYILGVVGLLFEPAELVQGVLTIRRSRMAMARVAAACNTTPSAVERIKRAFEEGGLDQVGLLKWGGGRRAQQKFTAEEIEWLVHPDTLKQQAHMSLPQRAGAMGVKFDKKVTIRDVRALFRDVGVSKQRYRSSLGPPKPTVESLAKQQVYLDAAKVKLEELTEKGYDIFQCDASVFSPDSFVPSAWAVKGSPPELPRKWTTKKYLAVFAAISERSGCLLQMYKLGAAFDA